jgi:hypothetical protein
MDHVRFAAVPLLLAALLTGCGGIGPLQQDTGVLTGEIRFIGTSPELQAHLQQNPARSGGLVWVHRQSDGAVAATTGYDVSTPGSNAPISATEWKVGNYTAAVPVSEEGDAFLVVVNSVGFASGGEYRFGFRELNPMASHLSETVPPQGTVTLNLQECAKLVPVRIRLTAQSSGDLEPLESAPETEASCVVTARVQDAGSFSRQASSPYIGFTAGTLTSMGGGEIRFPVRAQGQAVRLSATCSVRAPAGSDYVPDPNGWAYFTGPESEPMTLSCEGASLIEPIDLQVPVRRRPTGGLRGKFDFVGFQESGARIEAGSQSATPAPLPSEPPMSASWSFEGIPVGQVQLRATGYVGQDRQLTLPLSRLQLQENGVEELGFMFVVRPVEVAGKLILVDPTGLTRLPTLTTMESASSSSISNVTATGAEAAPQDPLGASAAGGVSTGRLHGLHTPGLGCLTIFQQGCWQLNYRLLLSGLSPRDGQFDGSDTRQTLWDVSGAELLFRDTSAPHRQRLTLKFAREMRHLSREPGVNSTVADVSMCMGQVELSFVATEGTGQLHLPEFRHPLTRITSSTTVLPVHIRDSSGDAQGIPSQPGGSSSTWVAATVPEGASYELIPSVQVRPPGASTSTLINGIPRVRIPMTGTLSCGQVERACLQLNSVVGSTARALQVSISDQPYCRPDGLDSLQFKVESNEEVLQRVQYSIDGIPTTHCEDCVMSALTPVTITPSLAAGTHTIVVTAVGSNGCEASSSYVFSACAPLPPVRQLAYFDDNRLNLVRLDTGLPVFTPVAVQGGVGPIRFNADGSRLAVRDTAGLRFFSAVDGSAQGAQVVDGVVDFQYRPRAAQADDRAMLVQSPGNGPMVLSMVLAGVPLADVLVPAPVGTTGIDSSRSRIAWAPDGTRVAVATVRGSGTQRRLVLAEWPLVGGVLGAGMPLRDWAILGGESLLAFAYEAQTSESRFAFVTTRSIYRATADGSLEIVRREPLMLADVRRPSARAVVPEANPTLAVLELQGAMMAASPTGQVYGVAVSDDLLTKPILAVARSATSAAAGSTRSVVVYRTREGPAGGLPSLVVDRELPAQRPHSPAFRPVGP